MEKMGKLMMSCKLEENGVNKTKTQKNDIYLLILKSGLSFMTCVGHV